MLLKLSPPSTDEYAPFYADYIQRAQSMDVLTALPHQIDNIQFALGHLTDEQARFRPGPEEWSVKQVMGHINDTERVFSYRLLRFSRNDATALPGFDQEAFIRAADFDDCRITDLMQEFEHLRLANILTIRNLKQEALDCRGTVSGFVVSVRALIFMMVGHVEHHMASLHEKYLPPISG